MIEKKINYIWLGGKPKSKIANICINSWKEKLPDYEIIEWNEKNLNLIEISKENRYIKECIKRKLWAYVSDYIRLKILYENGGIYFDTDVQVLKSFNSFLSQEAFIGMQSNHNYSAGVIATEKGNVAIKAIIDFYNNDIWNNDFYTINAVIKAVFTENSELLKHIKIYSKEYFDPIDFVRGFREEDISENTYSLHWYNASWANNKQVKIFLQTKHIRNPLKKRVIYIKKLLSYYYHKRVRKHFI